MLETLLDKVATLKTLLKRIFNTGVFPWNLHFLRTPVFTEHLQWLLLTFNSYFQSTPERKPVWLSTISARFSWKNGIQTTVPREKLPPQLGLGFRSRLWLFLGLEGNKKNKSAPTSVKEIIPEFFYPFI